jgi:hypothetical protein
MSGSAYGITNKLLQKNITTTPHTRSCLQNVMVASKSSGIEANTEIMYQVGYSLLLHLVRYQHKILLATGRISNVKLQITYSILFWSMVCKRNYRSSNNNTKLKNDPERTWPPQNFIHLHTT